VTITPSGATIGIKPMLATASSGQGNRRPREIESLDGYAFEEKIDGVRALVFYDAKAGTTILNRSGNDITLAFPEVVEAMHKGGPDMILDGEIVLRNGTFGDLNGRAKVTVAAKATAKAAAMPAKFVAFDVLSYGGEPLVAQPYTERRRMLLALGEAYNVHPAFEVVRASFDGRAFFEQVKADGGEGVIAKKISSLYKAGTRSPEWVKFKATQTVTCVAVSYEPGKGARAAFGAMHLAMVGGAKPLYVGRVGSGLSADAITACKAGLDRGEFVIVEIETLGRTPDNKLRFPVFKGIRSDQTVHDATIDQMDLLSLQ